jgi:hypothetical protein
LNTRLEEHIDDYKRLLIRSAKRADWTSKCSEISTFKDLAKLNKTLQNPTNRHALRNVKKPDGELTETIEEMANVLLDSHFPNSSNTDNNPTTDHSKNTIAPHHSWINPTIFRKAVALFKNNKAAGPDQIKPIVLKNLPDNTIERICTLYSASIELGYTPVEWRHAKVNLSPNQGNQITQTHMHLDQSLSLPSLSKP